MDPKLRVAFWVLGPLGLVLLAATVYLLVRTGSFVASAARARGKVVDLAESRSSDGASTWHPVVSFEVRGETIQFTSKFGSRPAPYDVGDGVEVLYDPDNPPDARIDSFRGLWLGPVLAGSLGLFFAGIAWLIWIGRDGPSPGS